MKIIMGCDHGAYEEKEELKKFLEEKGIEIEDVGTYKNERCSYSDFALLLCQKVIKKDCKGILLCGSGMGMSMASNKYKGIRAALCRGEVDAELSRQHNNSNVLCLGGRSNSMNEIKSITEAWLKAEFEEGRHIERLAKFENLGEDVGNENV